MSLYGKGLLAIWNDIDPQVEAEYNVWHTREHLPERVGIDGFIRGRRYVAWERERHRYFTLYEGISLETFSSELYVARLNAPTPWTQKMMPLFRNSVRGACHNVTSYGNGLGGALATVRLDLSQCSSALIDGNHNGVEEILSSEGLVGVHYSVADRKVTSVPTNERKLRSSTSDDLFDALLMVESVGRRELEESLPAVTRVLKRVLNGARVTDVAAYRLAFELSSLAGQTRSGPVS